MASQDKVPEKVQIAIFAQLLNNPHNGECADCGTASPNWVSLDFGVFICMRCSGVHRQIGPHITRVRSIKLDGWTKDNIEIMATVGNRVANDYYEHRMPTGYRRPGANSSADECRRFLDEKYIKKSFVPSGYQEPVKEFIACRTKGTKPDFSYSQKNQNKQQEPPKPVVELEQQASQELKFVRKKSASLDKFADHLHEKKVNQAINHPDLLSPAEVDLLGNYNEQNELQETHSASPPKKINFANFKKAQSQPALPHLQNQNQQGNLNNNLDWSQKGAQSDNASTSTSQPQPQENKVDLMKLYSQPQGHQNHFMQGMPHGWHNNGWNNQGYGTGHMGHQNHFQGGFPQNYGGQPGTHGNPNMGYNPYINYGGAHMGTGQGNSNGFVQAPSPNKFF